jgi:uncharacterized protein (DUF4415 family)
MGKQQKSFKPGRSYSKKDWDAVQSPELMDEQMAKAKPFAEALPDLAASIRTQERSASSACARPIKKKGSSMPNAKKKGYSARDLREVSDSPEWTKEDFAKAKPFAEVFPELAASIRKSGGPNIGTKKR